MSVKRNIREVLGLKEMGKKAVYLENMLIFGRNKSKEFSLLKDRLQAQLEGWRSQLLSKTGKATLIKAVAQALLVYTMATFLVSKGVFNEMDAMVRSFWWGSRKDGNCRMALKSWNSMCLPKTSGGLGFKRFSDINKALLGKLGWYLARGEENMWTTVFRHKYLKEKSFFF